MLSGVFRCIPASWPRAPAWVRYRGYLGGEHATGRLPLASPSLAKIEVNGQVISTATASGGYNVVSCETSQGPPSGNWADTNCLTQPVRAGATT